MAIAHKGGDLNRPPFVSPPNKYQYYLHLQDVSVENRRLNFSSNVFALKRDGSGGCTIDSGAPVTRIVQPAYQQVLKAFQKYFDNQGLQRVHLPQLGFDLCYRNSHTSAKLASISMTFHFEGADFEIDRQHMYVVSNDAFCVVLLQKHQTVLGAIVFDVAARQILSPENCLNYR